MNAPQFYECGICNHLHRWTFNGDCRNDAERFTLDDVPGDAEVATWQDRLDADRAHNAHVNIGVNEP